MKSPKFRLRSNELAEIISEPNLKTVWKALVRAAMRRQLIVDPIEFYDVQVNLNKVTQLIAQRVISGEYQPLHPKRLLVEKSKGLCRMMVVPHPYDCMILQCISNNLHPFLKAEAPHHNAFYEPERAFTSKATHPYGSIHAWLNFQKEILAFSRRRKIVVVTDIANYYDFINYSHLRNAIADKLPKKKESILDLMLFILGTMLWDPDYMPRIEVGLPQIDLDAPRLLAHTFLFELDQYVSTAQGIDYARFMDDIDLGVDDLATAKRMLRDIDLILQTRQIRLNSGKTKILIGKEVNIHFKVRENMIVGLLKRDIESRPTKIQRHRAILLYLLRRWERQQVFDNGNGEKILKQLINLASRIQCSIPDSTLLRYLTNRPNVRKEIFRHVAHQVNGFNSIPMLMEFIQQNTIVDDFCALYFSYTLVEMHIPTAIKSRKQLCDIGVWMSKLQRGPNWTYAGLWLLSKFASRKLLHKTVIETYKAWQADYHLGRLVATLDCLIGNVGPTFDALLRSARNSGIAEVLTFTDDLRDNATATNAILKFLKKPNPSYPNKITHSKWLVLLHVIGSPALTTKFNKFKKDLLKVHTMATTDHYYRIRIRAYL